ncbi:hypothetical protein I2F27_11420 [Acinetobacter sp. B5B]|uniref:hypothetical protein n=1 Tax=Acinetobacter baretiae TaxID=2605383 RepID=UPI0018C25CCE|nr:hypothetical protein [Acinetobacter baretiae]MBF7683928.1 hypothetical protein [Acinetobacter baretiae]
MKNKTNPIFFTLLIILYPFIWLYEQIGATLFWALILCCIIASFFYWQSKKSTNQPRSAQGENLNQPHINTDPDVFYASFNSECWHTINLPTAHPDTMRSANIHFMSHPLNQKHAECLRLIQIIRDSIDILNKTQNEDTAVSRMQVIQEMYDEVIAMSYLFKPKDFQRIEERFAELILPLHTIIYLNIAQGHVNKMESVKTDKTKLKYLLKAIESIEYGMNDYDANIEILQTMLDDLKAHPLYLKRIHTL